MNPPSPEKKRGKGLFILAGLLLVLVLLFPRYADQPRAYFGALWQRVLLWEALEKLDGVSSEAMEIDAGNDGSVWITSKYSILRVHPDGRREVIASPRQARKATGVDVGAFATSEVADDGTLWIGGWHGTLLSIAGDVITLHSERESPPKGRIHDITVHPDGVFVGGDGLWHIPDSQGALRRLDDGSLQVRALGISSQGQLVIASADSVLVRDGDALVPLWERADGDGALTALTPEPDGALLVGTRNGVIVLEPDGAERTRLLPGENIRGFSRDADGALWVATWQAGIAVPGADGWTTLGFTDGLPDDSVSDIAIDANGQMWLAVYGDGAFRAPAAEFQSLAAKRVRPVIDQDVQIFESACAAADTQSITSAGLGQIASVVDGERTRVFFSGRQVCPDAPGTRLDDGRWVVVETGALRIGGQDSVAVRALPKGLAASMVTAVSLDSSGNPWIGSRHMGVFEWRGTHWTAHGRLAGLAANPVQAMTHDREGQLWVATYPGVARGGGDKAGLHRYDGHAWHAIVPKTSGRQTFQLPSRGQYKDLASRNSNDVRVLQDGRIAVATNAGLSLLESPSEMESFDRYNFGLPSNYIQSVTEDDEQRLWLTHAYWGAGVSWRAGPIFRNRNTRDGLFADRLMAVAHDGSGKVWLQASDGRVGIYARDRLLR